MVSNGISIGVFHCLTAYLSLYLACLRLIVSLSLSFTVYLSFTV